MNVNINLIIGSTTTCQFGNSFDTDWKEDTHANQACEVVAIKKGLLGEFLYLIKTEKLLGTAYLSRNDSLGKLHCTLALPCNEEELVEKAYSLGFDL